MMYFYINEDTCGVSSVRDMVRRGFENPNLVLVQADGSEFMESEVTKGMLHELQN